MKSRLVTKDFIRKAKLIHGNTYDYSKVRYINNKTKVTIVCKEHGEFDILPINHVSNKHGCRKCANTVCLTNEEFIFKAIKIHGDKYDYSKVNYINRKTVVIIICRIHGEFITKPSSHIVLKTGCQKCHASKGELTIARWLKTNNIEFEEQKRFAECYNINSLPFDFYLPKYNLLIEYQGAQHFDGKLYYNREKSLKHRQELDAIKRSFCKENNIRLLEITYKQKIRETLAQYIEKIGYA
jgi:hypothetical protein